MKKIISSLTVFTIIAAILCGCQTPPNTEVIISKNDGVFQEKIDQTAPSQQEVPVKTPATINCFEQFTSTDGSVNFSVNIDQEVSEDVKQVVEVAPHPLTEEDIRRVAEVLLGNVVFYERRPSTNPQYSKAQYQAMISRYSAYSSQEALTNLMGYDGVNTYMEDFLYPLHQYHRW